MHIMEYDRVAREYGFDFRFVGGHGGGGLGALFTIAKLATVFSKLQIAGHARAHEPSDGEPEMVKLAKRCSIGAEE
jgi:hypothetical protein